MVFNLHLNLVDSGYNYQNISSAISSFFTYICVWRHMYCHFFSMYHDFQLAFLKTYTVIPFLLL